MCLNVCIQVTLTLRDMYKYTKGMAEISLYTRAMENLFCHTQNILFICINLKKCISLKQRCLMSTLGGLLYLDFLL